MRLHVTPATRLGRLPLLLPLLLVGVIAGCTATTAPSPAGSLLAPIETGAVTPSAPASASPAAPIESNETTAVPDVSPVRDDPSADAFWAAVERGLMEAGQLTVTAAGGAPVVVRYRSDASEALVEDDLVSRCIGERSWAGAGGTLAPVPGSWRCGAAALAAGFRAIAAPLDSWSPDFPVEGSPIETVTVSAGGTWTWSYAVDAGPEGSLSATIALDPLSGRILEGYREDETGRTTWTFDYATAVGPISAP